MAQVLSWVALVLAGLVLGHAFTRSAGAKTPLFGGLQPFLTAALGLLAAGALITLPTGAPWSSGQGLWAGFLTGGVAVLLAVVAGRRGRFGSEGGAFLAGSARIAAAALAMALLTAVHPALRHGILDVLGGAALGALTAGILFCAAALRTEHGEDLAEAAQAGALTTLALVTATFLALYHRDAAGLRDWLPLPSLLAATAAAVLTVRGVLGRGNVLLTAGVVAAPILVVAALVGYRLSGTPAFFYSVLIGLAVFAIVAWLERMEEVPQPRLRADVGLLTALIMLGGAALAFRERQGYGIALVALCGTFLWSASGERRSLLVPGGVALLLLVSLYRVFTETSAYSHGFQPDFLYFYVALVAGALLPALLARTVFRQPDEGVSPAPSLARAGLAGAAAAAAPLVVWLLVGERPQAAMLVGLAVGAGFLLSRAATGERTSTEVSLAGLLALAIGWSTVQFTHLLQPLALGTRTQRVTVLIGVGVVAVIAVLLSALLERPGTEPPRRQVRQDEA